MRRLFSLFWLLTFSFAVQATDKPLIFISLPGAGIAGLAQIRLLQEIQENTQRPLFEDVDGVAGTGAGAIVAAMLCVSDFFGKPIFDRPNLKERYIADAREIMDRWFRLDADEVLDRVLLKEFGTSYMSDSPCHLMIDAYKRDTGENVLFDSLLAKNAEYDLPVWQAIRASASIDFIPQIGFPFSSGTIKYNMSEPQGGFSDPGLHRDSDPTPFLVERIKELYPSREAVVYVLGAGKEPSKIQRVDEFITVVRIEPNFEDAKGGWLTPFLLDTSAYNIAYIENQAAKLMYSFDVKAMVRAFASKAQASPR